MRALYDVHGHFLPGMDDGCGSAEESLEVLRQAGQQGVQAMFATPHYYPVESIRDFLQRRETAAARLAERLSREADQQIPQVFLGAEVALRPGLSADPALEKLCLGGTEYLLLELPFRGWSSDTLREVRNISCTGGITPVLAHLERYVDVVPWRQLQAVLEMDVLVQVNAGSFLRFGERQAVKKLLRHTPIHLLGSDCHNLTTRKPNLQQAAAWLEKHKMMALLDGACDLVEQLCALSAEEYQVRW